MTGSPPPLHRLAAPALLQTAPGHSSAGGGACAHGCPGDARTKGTRASARATYLGVALFTRATHEVLNSKGASSAPRPAPRGRRATPRVERRPPRGRRLCPLGQFTLGTKGRGLTARRTAPFPRTNGRGAPGRHLVLGTARPPRSQGQKPHALRTRGVQGDRCGVGSSSGPGPASASKNDPAITTATR